MRSEGVVDNTPFMQAQENLRRLKDEAGKRLEDAEMQFDKAMKHRDAAQHEFRSITRAFDSLNGVSDDMPMLAEKSMAEEYRVSRGRDNY